MCDVEFRSLLADASSMPHHNVAQLCSGYLSKASGHTRGQRALLGFSLHVQ